LAAERSGNDPGNKAGFVAGSGFGGALLEGEGGGNLRAGSGPGGEFPGHFPRPVALQTLQNVRKTPFHQGKSNIFSDFFLYLKELNANDNIKHNQA
jgi:hypothetical protein